MGSRNLFCVTDATDFSESDLFLYYSYYYYYFFKENTIASFRPIILEIPRVYCFEFQRNTRVARCSLRIFSPNFILHFSTSKRIINIWRTKLVWNRKSSRINNEDFAIKELFTIIASLSWDIPTMQVYDPLLSLYSEIHIPVLYIGTVHADAMIKNYNTGGERKGETTRWHTRTS